MYEGVCVYTSNETKNDRALYALLFALFYNMQSMFAQLIILFAETLCNVIVYSCMSYDKH